MTKKKKLEMKMISLKHASDTEIIMLNEALIKAGNKMIRLLNFQCSIAKDSFLIN